MKHLTRFVPVVAAALLLSSGFAQGASFSQSDVGSKATKAAHIIEFQKRAAHDLSLAGGKDPELPVVTG